LIEYRSGETIQKDFLDEKGEGLHHILFVVNDLEKTVARFEREDVTALQQDRFVGGGGLAYMSTDKIGGVIMEIAQLPNDFDPAKGVQYLSSWDENDEA
jgi:hypothetical protein